MTTTRPCMHDDGYPAEPGKRKCAWHLLLKMPIEGQIEAAEKRRAEQDALNERLPQDDGYPYGRVPKAQWPAGERFCAGCQGFIPVFYASGSRCKAHNALAAHSGRLEKVYGIDRDTYVALLDLQGGVCFVCGQTPRSKRLAVDHDHKTGDVRGLLCADVERGCNHAVLGSLEARSVDGVIAAAYRLIDYMTKTPYQRLKEAQDGLQPPEPPPERGAGGVDDRAGDQGTLHMSGTPIRRVDALPRVPDADAAPADDPDRGEPRPAPQIVSSEPPAWAAEQLRARVRP